MRTTSRLACALALLLTALAPGGGAAAPAPDETVRVALLHLNDVYEITPLDQGRSGGLARIPTLRKELLKKYPAVATLHAGDFLSPSALGNARIDGERLAGRHMVAVLKAAGIDFIILGNHEFDLSEGEFFARLRELRELKDLPQLRGDLEQNTLDALQLRRRAIFSTNVRDRKGGPFEGVPRQRVWEARDPKSRAVLARVGLIGLTIKVKTDYATFIDPVEAAREQLKAWKDAGEKLNAVVALTHQSLDDDERLATRVAGIGLIVGGHEHENAHRRAPAGPPILRADANARTVYVHELVFDRAGRLLRVESKLRAVTDAIAEDPATAAVVREWVAAAYKGYRAEGLDPAEVLTTTREHLDGREGSVRNGATNLTDLIGDAMLAALPDGPAGGRLALFNGGSVRIDDFVPPGPVTVYDVLRVLPFGGELREARLKGSVVKRVLDRTTSGPNGTDPGAGTGAFLQTRNVGRRGRGADAVWVIGGRDLDSEKTYRVAANDYLLDGREAGYEFLKHAAEERRVGDLRKVIVEYLRKQKPQKP